MPFRRGSSARFAPRQPAVRARRTREEWDQRIDQLLPCQVSTGALAATGNPAVKNMHCLPSIRFHPQVRPGRNGPIGRTFVVINGSNTTTAKALRKHGWRPDDRKPAIQPVTAS